MSGAFQWDPETSRVTFDGERWFDATFHSAKNGSVAFLYPKDDWFDPVTPDGRTVVPCGGCGSIVLEKDYLLTDELDDACVVCRPEKMPRAVTVHEETE